MPNLVQTEHRPLAVITGASTGLGKSYAKQLAAQHYDLLIVARRRELLDAIKNELETQFGIAVESYPANLADENQVKQLAAKLESLPQLDYMINNAGFGLRDRFPNVDIESEIKMIRVHCEAVVRLCQAALKPMCRQKNGVIINVASLAAYLTGPGAAEYCATKAFLKSFSECLQFDVAEHGVHVQALCPGFVRTEFHDSATMTGYDMNVFPGMLWLDCDRVVRDSLRVAEKKRRKVVFIPSLRYKILYAVTHIPILSPILQWIVQSLFQR